MAPTFFGEVYNNIQNLKKKYLHKLGSWSFLWHIHHNCLQQRCGGRNNVQWQHHNCCLQILQHYMCNLKKIKYIIIISGFEKIGDFGMTLEWLWKDFGGTLEGPWRDSGGTLEGLWRDSGRTLRWLEWLWNDFRTTHGMTLGMTLEWLWNDFRTTFGMTWNNPGMNLEWLC